VRASPAQRGDIARAMILRWFMSFSYPQFDISLTVGGTRSHERFEVFTLGG
jgi:hypothetical protein